MTFLSLQSRNVDLTTQELDRNSQKSSFHWEGSALLWALRTASGWWGLFPAWLCLIIRAVRKTPGSGAGQDGKVCKEQFSPWAHPALENASSTFSVLRGRHWWCYCAVEWPLWVRTSPHLQLPWREEGKIQELKLSLAVCVLHFSFPSRAFTRHSRCSRTKMNSHVPRRGHPF